MTDRELNDRLSELEGSRLSMCPQGTLRCAVPTEGEPLPAAVWLVEYRLIRRHI